MLDLEKLKSNRLIKIFALSKLSEIKFEELITLMDSSNVRVGPVDLLSPFYLGEVWGTEKYYRKFKEIIDAKIALTNPAPTEKIKLEIQKKVEEYLNEQRKLLENITKPTSLPGMLLACNAIEAPELHNSFVESPVIEIKKIQKDLIDDVFRTPILKILKDKAHKKEPLIINDIKDIMKEVTQGFAIYDKVIQEKIKDQEDKISHILKNYVPQSSGTDKKYLLELIKTNKLSSNLGLFLTFLEDEKKSFNESIPEESKPQLKIISDLHDELEKIHNMYTHYHLSQDFYKGTMNECIVIYNDIESQKLTESFYRANKELEQNQFSGKEKEAKKEDRTKLAGMLKFPNKFRRLMFSKAKDNRFRQDLSNHSGKYLFSMQQGSIPALGSSEGLCYGFSALFLNNFYESQDMEANKFNQYLADNNKPLSEFDLNILTANIDAYESWYYQSISNHDTIYISEPHQKESHIVKKRKDYCNQIIHFSERIPCTFMLGLHSEGGGHAIGFARNKNGIWLHDSNFGLVFFDSSNPNFTKNFKNFFEKHIKKYYPNPQNDLIIRNTAVPYLVKNAITLANKHLDLLELLTNSIESDVSNNDNKTLTECLELIQDVIPHWKHNYSPPYIKNILIFGSEQLQDITEEKEELQDAIEAELDPTQKIALQDKLTKLTRIDEMRNKISSSKILQCQVLLEQSKTLVTELFQNRRPITKKEDEERILQLNKNLDSYMELFSEIPKDSGKMQKDVLAILLDLQNNKDQLQKAFVALENIPPLKNPSRETRFIKPLLNILLRIKKMSTNLLPKFNKKGRSFHLPMFSGHPTQSKRSKLPIQDSESLDNKSQPTINKPKV